jgi:hypothetical protein
MSRRRRGIRTADEALASIITDSQFPQLDAGGQINFRPNFTCSFGRGSLADIPEILAGT